jgi:hypothetical protein
MQQARPSSWTFLGLKIQGDLGPFTCYTSKRGRVVWYLKAPPTTPPTDTQIAQRNAFRYAAAAWNAFAAEERAQWETAAKRACLRITGYDLCTYYFLTEDNATLETLEHQTGRTIPRPERIEDE